jgi:hypothetical protein
MSKSIVSIQYSDHQFLDCFHLFCLAESDEKCQTGQHIVVDSGISIGAIKHSIGLEKKKKTCRGYPLIPVYKPVIFQGQIQLSKLEASRCSFVNQLCGFIQKSKISSPRIPIFASILIYWHFFDFQYLPEFCIFGKNWIWDAKEHRK